MAWDEKWDDIFANNEWGRYPEENLIRFMSSNYYSFEESSCNKIPIDGIKILEIGCGTGANLWYISREGFKCYGIDGSKLAIEKANNRLNRNNKKVELTVGDVMSLPYGDGFFDAVIDIECIYANSLNDSKVILSEVCRVLKPSGLFYSKSASDRMYKGKNYKKASNCDEYTSISDGPLSNVGLVRLMTKEDVYDLYSQHFVIEKLDLTETTRNNMSFIVSEWIIICCKV